MKKLPTSTQPEPAKTRIYGGGKKPKAIDGASNQPEVLPHIKVYGSKKTRQIRVRRKADKSKTEMLIPFADFDPAKHARVD